MHFCDLNHQVTRLQQDEKQQHKRAESNCMFDVDDNTKTTKTSGLGKWQCEVSIFFAARMAAASGLVEEVNITKR